MYLLLELLLLSGFLLVSLLGLALILSSLAVLLLFLLVLLR